MPWERSSKRCCITIIRLGDEAYGRAILKDVQERLERDVAPGAVHVNARPHGEEGPAGFEARKRAPRSAPDARAATTA